MTTDNEEGRKMTIEERATKPQGWSYPVDMDVDMDIAIKQAQQEERERIVEMIEEENHRHVHTHRGYNQRQWCKECGENIITKIKKTVTLSVIRELGKT